MFQIPSEFIVSARKIYYFSTRFSALCIANDSGISGLSYVIAEAISGKKKYIAAKNRWVWIKWVLLNNLILVAWK